MPMSDQVYGAIHRESSRIPLGLTPSQLTNRAAKFSHLTDCHEPDTTDVVIHGQHRLNNGELDRQPITGRDDAVYGKERRSTTSVAE